MSSEEERDNFFSLTLLLFCNGNQRLREYFKTQWPIVYQRVKPGTVPPPWQDTPDDATEMKNIQPTKLIFNFPDEETKFNSGNTNDWDFSLLTTVLRYSSLHFVLPGSDECKGLDDLKAIRNTLIGYATDAAIPNVVFNTEWTKACDALKLFNATEDDFKAVQNDVKEPLDALYPMLEQCIRQEKEIQDAVDTKYLAACLFVKKKEVPDTKETSGQTLVFMSGLLSKEKDEQLMKKLMEGIEPGDEGDDANKLLTLQCLYEYGDDELSKLTINNLHDKYCNSDGWIEFDGITDVRCLSYLLKIIHLLLQEHHVQSFSHVHALYIVNSPLTSCGVGVVCESLVHHSYIPRLVLQDCSLDDDSVEVITNSLLNTEITELDLAINNITDKGAESILNVSLQDNCCVEELNLQDNEKITEECKERLRRLVQEEKPHFKLSF